MGRMKCWSLSPSVCVPGGGICLVWEGGSAILPVPLTAWLESEMLRFNMIYKHFPASAMNHIPYKALSTVLFCAAVKRKKKLHSIC